MSRESITFLAELIALLLIVWGGARWVIKHYVAQIMAELKPNGGSSIKDQVTRLEERVNEADQLRRDMNVKLDKMYNILLDHVAQNTK